MTPAATRRSGSAVDDGLAGVLTRTAESLAGRSLPIRLRAWDGSESGPADAPLVELRSPDALRRLLRHPGELGAAQAYVTGELELHGDLGDALHHVLGAGRERRHSTRPRPAALWQALRTLAHLGVVGPPPAPPASQARVRGWRHTRRRDRSAISHHYDLSNAFYELVLDPSMAYSCAYFGDDPAAPLERAQRAKLDLVCRKLDLGPGRTLLDVGCGWGALSIHAAEHHGARVVGVTISAQQQEYAVQRIRERGLDDRVEIRLQDYRDVAERDHFDAVGSLEMGEHVGAHRYPTYVEVLRHAVRPGGRVLVQQMSRASHPGGGPFIESFIAPDMHMRPLGETVALLERGGLEVRDVQAMREHYVRTVAGWLERFEAHRHELAALVGDEIVRVWRLYLVGGSLAFREGRMGVDQILCVRPGADHSLTYGRTW